MSHPQEPLLLEGGIDLVFQCQGRLADGKAHGPTTTDLTGLLQGGNPLCCELECSAFDDELDFVGWRPSDPTAMQVVLHPVGEPS